MPLPLLLAPIAESVVARLAATTLLDRVASLGILGAYLGHEQLKDSSNPFGSAPSGTKTTPVKFGSTPVPKTNTAPSVPVVPATPVAPSMAKILTPTLDDYLKSLNRQKANTQSLSTTLTTAGTAVKERNDALTQTAGASKFLVNQVEAKASLDEVSFALNAQSVVHAMIYETLDRNLSLISASLVASAQTAKVATDHAGTVASAPPVPDYSDKLERMAKSADSAKIVHEHAHTVRDIADLDGVVVARAAPMEIVAARNAAQAREKTDIINETFDDTDNPLSSFDLMPLLNFVGRGDTFDVSKTLSNVFKPDGV